MGIRTRVRLAMKALFGDRRSWFRELYREWRAMTIHAGPGSVVVTPDTALTLTAVWAAVKVLSESVASLPLHVYERLERGKRRAVEHPLHRILHDEPNEDMTSFDLISTLMMHVLLWGNGYAQIVRDNGGRVVALWILLPNRMEVMRREDGRLVYVYDSRRYGRVALDPSEVLHIRGLGFDGLKGYSVISYFRRTLGIALAAETYGERFFANSARPGGVLKHPGKLSEEAYRRLRQSWEELHQGPENVGRVAILEEGMEYQAIGLPPEDAQFLETRKFQVAEVARIFRVPPHMLADLERATFSNIEQQSIEFVVHSLRPWLVRWEKAIQQRLFVGEEKRRYFAQFLVEGLLRGDTESRYKAYAIGRQWGWLSANDVRELENMNPVEGGDVYLVPLNMIPAGQAVGQNEGSSEPGRRGRRETRAAVAGDMETVRRMASVRVRLREVHSDAILDAFKRMMRKEANDIRQQGGKVLRKQGKEAFFLWLEGYLQRHREHIPETLFPVMVAYARQVAEAAAAEVGAEEVGVDVDTFVRAYLDTYATGHIARSRALLREKLEQSEDPEQDLDDEMERWKAIRAAEEAQDENVQLGNAIAKAVFVASGVRYLMWVSFGESCPVCERLSGRIVGVEGWFVGKGEKVTGESADGTVVEYVSKRWVGHPPLHRGCDCAIVAA